MVFIIFSSETPTSKVSDSFWRSSMLPPAALTHLAGKAGKCGKTSGKILENPGKMSQNLGSKSAEKNAGTGYSVWTILEPTC
jgi:hypothetical protein